MFSPPLRHTLILRGAGRGPVHMVFPAQVGGGDAQRVGVLPDILPLHVVSVPPVHLSEIPVRRSVFKSRLTFIVPTFLLSGSQHIFHYYALDLDHFLGGVANSLILGTPLCLLKILRLSSLTA